MRDEQGKRSKEGKRKAVDIDELPTLPEDKSKYDKVNNIRISVIEHCSDLILISVIN